MPIQSPFHERTSALCTSHRWKEWAGYHAVCSFDTCHEQEYLAFRHSAGLLDVTPLYKYRVEGPDAAAFLAYVSARDVTRLSVGQVAYGCWCDERGKVLDDGTVARLDDRLFRMTSADPSLAWLLRHADGFDLDIEDVTDSIAALSIQGPTSRAILARACDDDVENLRFFRATSTTIAGVQVEVTRTGYTGDLGYEVWIPSADAIRVWDTLMESGKPLGIEPAGLDALDVTRIEAGFILMGVEYRSARTCMKAFQKSTPYEVGLGWTVHLDRSPFVGSETLRAERAAGPAWKLVGLEIDYEELEALYESFDLPVSVPAAAWRTPVPVYEGTIQVGYATSGAWSPTLKKNLALASVRSGYSANGRKLSIEQTVEFQRRRVTARVTKRPFFDPERKRS